MISASSLEKEKKITSKVSREKEVMKMREEINEPTKPKDRLFEKIKNIDKHPAELTKKKRRQKLLISEMEEGTLLRIQWT